MSTSPEVPGTVAKVSLRHVMKMFVDPPPPPPVTDGIPIVLRPGAGDGPFGTAVRSVGTRGGARDPDALCNRASLVPPQYWVYARATGGVVGAKAPSGPLQLRSTGAGDAPAVAGFDPRAWAEDPRATSRLFPRAGARCGAERAEVLFLAAALDDMMARASALQPVEAAPSPVVDVARQADIEYIRGTAAARDAQFAVVHCGLSEVARECSAVMGERGALLDALLSTMVRLWHDGEATTRRAVGAIEAARAAFDPERTNQLHQLARQQTLELEQLRVTLHEVTQERDALRLRDAKLAGARERDRLAAEYLARQAARNAALLKLQAGGLSGSRGGAGPAAGAADASIDAEATGPVRATYIMQSGSAGFDAESGGYSMMLRRHVADAAVQVNMDRATEVHILSSARTLLDSAGRGMAIAERLTQAFYGPEQQDALTEVGHYSVARLRDVTKRALDLAATLRPADRAAGTGEARATVDKQTLQAVMQACVDSTNEVLLRLTALSRHPGVVQATQPVDALRDDEACRVCGRFAAPDPGISRRCLSESADSSVPSAGVDEALRRAVGRASELNATIRALQGERAALRDDLAAARARLAKRGVPPMADASCGTEPVEQTSSLPGEVETRKMRTVFRAVQAFRKALQPESPPRAARSGSAPAAATGASTGATTGAPIGGSVMLRLHRAVRAFEDAGRMRAERQGGRSSVATAAATGGRNASSSPLRGALGARVDAHESSGATAAEPGSDRAASPRLHRRPTAEGAGAAATARLPRAGPSRVVRRGPSAATPAAATARPPKPPTAVNGGSGRRSGRPVRGATAATTSATESSGQASAPHGAAHGAPLEGLPPHEEVADGAADAPLDAAAAPDGGWALTHVHGLYMHLARACERQQGTLQEAEGTDALPSTARAAVQQYLRDQLGAPRLVAQAEAQLHAAAASANGAAKGDLSPVDPRVALFAQVVEAGRSDVVAISIVARAYRSLFDLAAAFGGRGGDLDAREPAMVPLEQAALAVVSALQDERHAGPVVEELAAHSHRTPIPAQRSSGAPLPPAVAQRMPVDMSFRRVPAHATLEAVLVAALAQRLGQSPAASPVAPRRRESAFEGAAPPPQSS